MLTLTALINELSPEVQQIKLIEQITSFAGDNGMSDLDIKSNIGWILKFSNFHNKHHPADLNPRDIESYLSSLAIENNYSASTQSVALSAIKFLYQDFLNIPLGHIEYVKNKSRRGFSDYFSLTDCNSVIKHTQGTSQLMIKLAVYGRLKLKEVTTLRLTDINIKKSQITVRNSRGEINFILNIPIHLILDIRIQMMRIRQTSNSKELYRPDISNSLIRNSEYLFPLSGKNISFRPSRLELLNSLKNDIKLAIKLTARYSNSNTVSQIAFSRNNYSKYFNDNKIKKSSIRNSSQASFNFGVTRKMVTNDFRMLELKKSVA